MPTEIAELIFEANTSQLTAANQELNTLNKIAPKVQSNLGRMTSSFKVQSNAAQVAAFQVQDFAVQVGSGQSAMTAFTQQAPQFLGVFGAGGAILGTIVAITSAIAGPLITEIFNTDKATDILAASLAALNDIIDQTDGKTDVLSDSFAKLAQSSSILSQAQVREALLKTSDALDAANKEALSLAVSLSPNELGGRFDRVSLKMALFRQQFVDGKINLEQFNENVSDLFLQTGDPSKAFRSVREELAKISSEAASAAKARDVLLGGTGGLSSLSDQDDLDNEAKKQAALAEARARAEAYAENARIAALDKSYYQIEDSLRSETQLINDTYNERLAIVRAYNAQNQIDKESALEVEMQLEQDRQERLKKLRDKELAEDQALQSAKLSAQMNSIAALGAALQQAAEEGSAAAKIGYALTQGVAVAQAIVNANLAYSGMIAAAASAAALAGPAAPAVFASGQVQAEVVRGIGYATAGLIAGQTVGSIAGGRAQGGQVRPGQAYRVGEYGPETLIMGNSGGSIVPTGAANDSGVTLITNVKIEGGTGNEKVTNTKSTDDQGRIVQSIIVSMANDKTSGLMRGIFNNTTAQPKGNR